MKTKQFVYTGCENLEAMTEAVNYNRFLINLIVRQRGTKANKDLKVLDFGAGSGTYAKMLRDKGINPDCLEPDATLQKVLRANSFTVLPDSGALKPNSYDIIYALNVFEHIEDDMGEIKKLQAALKKGGRLLIYVPAYQVLFSSMDKTVGHYRRYRTERLKKMAEGAKLTIKELYYYDPAGFWAALVYKVIGGKGVLSPRSVRTYDRFVFPLSKMLHPISRKLIGKNAILVAEK